MRAEGVNSDTATLAIGGKTSFLHFRPSCEIGSAELEHGHKLPGTLRNELQRHDVRSELPTALEHLNAWLR